MRIDRWYPPVHEIGGLQTEKSFAHRLCFFFSKCTWKNSSECSDNEFLQESVSSACGWKIVFSCNKHRHGNCCSSCQSSPGSRESLLPFARLLTHHWLDIKITLFFLQCRPKTRKETLTTLSSQSLMIHRLLRGLHAVLQVKAGRSLFGNFSGNLVALFCKSPQKTTNETGVAHKNASDLWLWPCGLHCAIVVFGSFKRTRFPVQSEHFCCFDTKKNVEGTTVFECNRVMHSFCFHFVSELAQFAYILCCQMSSCVAGCRYLGEEHTHHVMQDTLQVMEYSPKSASALDVTCTWFWCCSSLRCSLRNTRTQPVLEFCTSSSANTSQSIFLGFQQQMRPKKKQQLLKFFAIFWGQSEEFILGNNSDIGFQTNLNGSFFQGCTKIQSTGVSLLTCTEQWEIGQV